MEAGQTRSVFFPGSDYVATLFGPDLASVAVSLSPDPGDRGLLEASLSRVVDQREIRDLPLAGRDVYALLALQTGVTSDATTARGLGLSTAGERPSASNFMLDGLEANHRLLGGPVMPVSTNAVEEYRISTSNYSAEFGGTSGFIANAISAAGGGEWHGDLYTNLKNEKLNANGFQQNRLGMARPASRFIQPGIRFGGPIWNQTLFTSTTLEFLRTFNLSSPVQLTVPTTNLIGITAPGSVAHQLLTSYLAPLQASGRELTGQAWFAPPLTVNRTFALVRADFAPPDRKCRVMARTTVSAASQPDFVWSPYRDFTSGLQQPATNAAVTLAVSPRPNFFEELRLGYDRDRLGWDRAHPEIPTLIDNSIEATVLPGSPAFYGYSNRGRTWQAQTQAFWNHDTHIFKFGGGLLFRTSDGYLSAGNDGRYAFRTVVSFAADLPEKYSVALDRTHLPNLQLPDSWRQYRYRQAALFAQDDWRVTSRLTLNLGLRYEFSGAPMNSGPQRDAVVRLGSDRSLAERLATARLEQAGIDEPLYRSGSGVLAPRAGFALRLDGAGRTALRGSWGLFYDRPFDNLWQNIRNNGFTLASFTLDAVPRNYLQAPATTLRGFQGQLVAADFPDLTLLEHDWKPARSASYFVAVDHQFAGDWRAEVQGLGNRGRHLVSTDFVNRPFSLSAEEAGPDNPERSLNPSLPLIAYRGNQGFSNYHAFSASLDYRSRHVTFRAGYTWARVIDNQSDAIAGDFFDLNFARIGTPPESGSTATFSRQFDPQSDRGDADFDQRQNLVIVAMWELPSPIRWRRWLGGWSIAQLAAFRTGFPFTVYAPTVTPESGGVLWNQRADMQQPQATATPRRPIAGGYSLLDASAFAPPNHSGLGMTGRNSFRGPGMYNLDLGMSRAFAVRELGKRGRVVARVDAFNVLNHANLNPPDSLITSPSFGQALFGRVGKSAGFPSLAPFRETARELQILVRLEF